MLAEKLTKEAYCRVPIHRTARGPHGQVFVRGAEPHRAMGGMPRTSTAHSSPANPAVPIPTPSPRIGRKNQKSYCCGPLGATHFSESFRVQLVTVSGLPCMHVVIPSNGVPVNSMPTPTSGRAPFTSRL